MPRRWPSTLRSTSAMDTSAGPQGRSDRCRGQTRWHLCRAHQPAEDLSTAHAVQAYKDLSRPSVR
jgi:hypothetical protein